MPRPCGGGRGTYPSGCGPEIRRPRPPILTSTLSLSTPASVLFFLIARTIAERSAFASFRLRASGEVATVIHSCSIVNGFDTRGEAELTCATTPSVEILAPPSLSLCWVSKRGGWMNEEKEE